MTQSKKPSFKFEKSLWTKGFNKIAGVDEVGRGAFAGPLVAAAVVLPANFKAREINDSKLLTSSIRKGLYEYIINNSISYSISVVNLPFINKFGVGEANHKALRDCLKKISFDFVLVDGFKIKDFDFKKQKPIINGDKISISVACASIIAKVYRDSLMEKIHFNYPSYNFFKNKGYGTKQHQEALRIHGLSEIHRTSFNLQKYLN